MSSEFVATSRNERFAEIRNRSHEFQLNLDLKRIENERSIFRERIRIKALTVRKRAKHFKIKIKFPFYAKKRPTRLAPIALEKSPSSSATKLENERSDTKYDFCGNSESALESAIKLLNISAVEKSEDVQENIDSSEQKESVENGERKEKQSAFVTNPDPEDDTQSPEFFHEVIKNLKHFAKWAFPAS